MFDIGMRAEMNVTKDAINNDCISRLRQIDDVGHIANRSNAESARHDRNMAQSAGFLKDKASNLRPAILSQCPRAPRTRDNDRIAWQILMCSNETLAR